MKKILFISSVSSHWGSEESLFILLQSVKSHGWVPFVYTQDGPFQKRLDQNGFENACFRSCTLTKRESAKFFYTVFYFAFMAVRGRFSLIHTNDIHSAQFASLSAKLARIPVVAHVRSPALEGWIDRPMNLRLLKLCDAMIAISADVEMELIRIGLDRKKIVVIPNAVDLQKFVPGVPKGSARADLGISGMSPVIGILGRILPLKGHRYLLLAIPRLLERYPDLKVLIVGEDTSPGNDSLQNILALVKRLDIAEAVHFIPHTSDVAKILSALDVLVVPSLLETFGRVVIEAMAMKVPVVASRVGGIPEIIKDGENGLLVPPEDAESISRAVDRLLSNSLLYNKIVEEGRFKVEKSYSMKRHGDLMIQVYSKLLAKCDAQKFRR